MTDYEFTQIMREAGYEVDARSSLIWHYKKNHNFVLLEYKKPHACELMIEINANSIDSVLYYYTHKFKDLKQMNSIEFKKKLEGITEYAYSLYMDINRHIDALSKKMETKANRLGL